MQKWFKFGKLPWKGPKFKCALAAGSSFITSTNEFCLATRDIEAKVLDIHADGSADVTLYLTAGKVQAKVNKQDLIITSTNELKE